MPQPSTSSPLVSIPIPAYNGEKYIEQAIMSALTQSYLNIEVIVVDDASTDRTRDIVRSIDDERLHLYCNKQNQGPTASWNRCMDLAKGEFVKLLCHDDVLYENAISIQVDVLNSFPDVALVAANRDIIDSKGKLVYKLRRFKEDRLRGGLDLIQEAIRKGTNVIGEPNAVLIRADIIRSNNIRFGKDFYVIDFDFYCKILLHGNAYTVSKALSAFRVSAESASVGLASKQASLFLSYVKKLSEDPNYKISTTDYLICRASSKLQQVMKMIFYSIYIK